MENKRPIYAVKEGKFIQVGVDGDTQFADVYWAWRGECVKGNHIILMVGIQKQVHCPRGIRGITEDR